MNDQISQRELRNDSGHIVRALDDGTSFVVTRNGAAVAELRPLCSHRFVDAQAVVAASTGAPGVDDALLRRDLDRVAGPSFPDRV